MWRIPLLLQDTTGNLIKSKANFFFFLFNPSHQLRISQFFQLLIRPTNEVVIVLRQCLKILLNGGYRPFSLMLTFYISQKIGKFYYFLICLIKDGLKNRMICKARVRYKVLFFSQEYHCSWWNVYFSIKPSSFDFGFLDF